MSEDPTPYIRESNDKINKPAICATSQQKIELSNGDLVYLNDNYRPLSEIHRNRATYIASVQKSVGYPWNGIHPETGETQVFESTDWWTLQDLKPI